MIRKINKLDILFEKGKDKNSKGKTKKAETET